MGKINFNYSLKNIPTLTKTSYQLMLMAKLKALSNESDGRHLFTKRKIQATLLTQTMVLRQGTTRRNAKNCKTLKKTY